eukprot:g2024.t1
MEHYSCFIDNEWIESSSGDRLEVEDPATGVIWATVPDCTGADVDRALESSAKAQKAWALLPPIERAGYLYKIADGLRQEREHFATLLVREQGKTLAEAGYEVDDTIRYITYSAEAARRLKGDVLPSDAPNEQLFIYKVPFGVTVGLCAYNYPLALIGRKIGPALVTGNTMILKPHEATPVTASEFCRVVREAGVPRGVINLISGSGIETAVRLVESPLTRLVTLTGSIPAGQGVARAASRNLAALSLELGGKAPFIVLKDSNIDEAVEAAAIARFANCGQVCICAETVLVEDTIADEFTEKLLKRSAEVRPGNPMQNAGMGPLTTGAAERRVSDLVDLSVKQGAEIALGGGRPSGAEFESGNWMNPTILVNANRDTATVREEIFGPVLPIVRVGDYEEALDIANDRPDGLSAYLWTRNSSIYMDAIQRMETGTIFLNKGIVGYIQGYHNGHKLSGLGGEDDRLDHLPLDGFLVVDLSQFLAGPYASLRLQDLGARVVKIERPDGGDLSRQLYFSDTMVDSESTIFHAINRGKESMSLNLKDRVDLNALQNLISKADVFIQNFRPGVVDRLGLGYEDVKSFAPHIVYGSVSGYGPQGPWAHFPGQDLLAQARSGAMWLNGDADHGPIPFGLAVADMFSGANLTQGILAALVRRGKTGKGAHVETSLLESMVDLQFEVLATHLNDGGRLPQRSKLHSAHAGLSAPYGVYPTKDGYLAIAMTPISQLADLLEIVDLHEYACKPETWFRQRDDIKQLIGAKLITRNTQDWLAILQPHDIWCAQVLDWSGFLNEDAFLRLDLIQDLSNAEGRSVRLTRSPLRINGGRGASRHAAPALGQHTAAIREEFDLVQEFISAGVQREMCIAVWLTDVGGDMTETFDHIVIGGGSAGSVAASRLVEDGKARVLLLEAGHHHRHPLLDMPPGVFKLLKNGSKFFKTHKTTPQEHLGGRVNEIPQGNVLGGGSSVNGQAYVRGRPSDYDEWQDILHGNNDAIGWSWQDVLPHFRRLEANQKFNNELHGTDGKLIVSDPGYIDDMARWFVQSLQAQGEPYNPDFNGPTQRGAGYFQFTYNKGQRISAAYAFLDPLKNDPNLTIRLEAEVQKILIENGRAVGVRYRDKTGVHEVRANGEVILSAGALITPKILMLSGIGPSAHLKEMGIDVVAELPGVGQNLQDHPDVSIVARATGPYGYHGHDSGLKMILNGLQFKLFGSGRITTTGLEAAAFVNPADSDAPATLEAYCIPILYLEPDVLKKIGDGPGVSIQIVLLKPRSRGEVKLASPDPSDMPSISPNFLKDPQDMELMISGLRYFRKTLETQPMAARVGDILAPDPADFSDSALGEHCKKVVKTNYHPVGTAKMGADTDGLAVLDARMRSGRTSESASQLAGVCRRTARKWLRRHLDEGVPGLQDRASRPEKLHRPADMVVVLQIIVLRRQRLAEGLSYEFCELVLVAAEQKCGILQLDQDAEEDEGFTTFDGNEPVITFPQFRSERILSASGAGCT